MPRPTRLVLAATLLFGAATAARAQRGSLDDADARWLEQCRSGWNHGGQDRGRACEIRVIPMRLSSRSIVVDGRENGSIRVEGWNADSVRVTARLQSNARDDAAAEQLLRDVKVMSDAKGVRADGPDERGRESWSVSYAVRVPRRFALSLEAQNGALGVTDVVGKMDLNTVNGSLSLHELGGEVHARTQNGSVSVELAGDRWEGGGLDAETENGSVRLLLPERYAARLETGTVNGSIHTDFPVTVQGRISRQLDVPLNGGGPTIRAMTTNGTVRISRR